MALSAVGRGPAGRGEPLRARLAAADEWARAPHHACAVAAAASAAAALLLADPPPLPPDTPLLVPADLPWVTAWTDGAGSHPASCGIARAAWAVHFAALGSALGRARSADRSLSSGLGSFPRSYRPPF